MKFGPACLLFALGGPVPARAVDTARPARVSVTVRDAAGRPLPRAAVSLDGRPVALDAGGRGAGRTPDPTPRRDVSWDVSWDVSLRVTLPGFLPYDGDLSCFPGARLERTIILEPSRTTTFRFRDARGRPAPGVHFGIGYEKGGTFEVDERGRTADARGESVWTHLPLPSGFRLFFPSSGHGARVRRFADAASVTATVGPDELPAGFPARPMRLTLLLPDGTPARGWRVGPNARVTSSWGSVGGLNGPLHHGYSTDPPLVADAHGVARFRQSEEHFVVVSPQGVPFLYPLHPATWPAGEHRVTLTLPAVRRVQTGRLVYKDGRPAAAFPLRVANAYSGTEIWNVDGAEPAGTFATDAQGRYALPQYFGTRFEYGAARRSWYAYDLSTGRATLTPTRDPPPDPRGLKEVTLTVADEAGKARPGFDVEARAGANDYLRPASDSVGVHFFVPGGAASLTITAKSRDWKPLTRTLDVTGTDDRAFSVTVPQALHLKPLAGVLLGADGRPVPGVSVSLRGVNPRPGTMNQEYTGFNAKTDARGRFAFAAAPDAGEISLSRFGPDDQPDLPGWTDPPPITPRTREMVIRLNPVGSVRALLPLSVAAPLDRVYLKGRDYYAPRFDGAAHTLHWAAVPPGDYALSVGRGGKDETLQTVTVRPNQETVTDLRSQAAAFPAPPAPTTLTISVYDHDAKPISGAAITLWTDRAGHYVGDTPLPADLTDETGTARLPLGVGQYGVAVARAPGRWIGWASATGADGGSLSIALSTPKTIAVHLPPLPPVDGKAPYDTRAVRLFPAESSPDGAGALFAVLGLSDAGFGTAGPNKTPRVSLVQDTPGTWLAEDLPPWEYRLETESGLTLSGSGPAVVDVLPEGRK